ncbi:MAG: hypothetical protein H7X71_00850 [Chitinophagales bacterium]|nr:hypothetical protein [Chitinophagales bacterium]
MKRKKPNVEHIHVDVNIVRFEQTLMQADGRTYRSVIDSLKYQHPDFYNLFVHNILAMPENDPGYNIYDTLYKYMITDSYMNRLYDSVQNLYADMRDVESEIETAFTYYTYYFPSDTLPQVYTYIAPFVYQVAINDHALGIELNMYMGKNFAYYSSFAATLPQYLLYNFERRNIVVNIMRMLADGKIPAAGPEGTLLDDMITEGKMLYYLDLVLPDMADSVKIGFTQQQMDWCVQNEVEVWKFFAGEDLLFSKSLQDKQKYLGDASSTYHMPEESPGRVAVWVGWQIIREYMQKQKEITLQQLFAETDGLKILKESDYDPE